MELFCMVKSRQNVRHALLVSKFLDLATANQLNHMFVEIDANNRAFGDEVCNLTNLNRKTDET